MSRVEDCRAVAEKCAENIRAYWAERGYDVKVKIQNEPSAKGTVHQITSDMKNGYPKNYRKAG